MGCLTTLADTSKSIIWSPVVICYTYAKQRKCPRKSFGEYTNANEEMGGSKIISKLHYVKLTIWRVLLYAFLKPFRPMVIMNTHFPIKRKDVPDRN